MKLRGNVIAKTEVVAGISQTTNKEWKNRSIVICENPNAQYPNDIAIEFHNDKCDLLKTVGKNDIVEVDCAVSSQEYQGKWYTKVRGWGLVNISKQQASTAPTFTPEPETQPTNQPQPTTDENNDLPF